ncbi:MAG: M48 family metalloprotease [Chloroflexia bacterium]|nr:M48 family metalloprotease [Chloroflexia bacterium]
MLRTPRFNRRLRNSGPSLPARLVHAGKTLSIAERLTDLGWAEPAACWYGFVRPRVEITVGLLQRLDEKELLTVLAHERRHLCRRDTTR